jgi:hypothetical protein
MERRPNHPTLYDAAPCSLGERLDQVSEVLHIPWKEKLGVGKVCFSVAFCNQNC